LALNFKVFDKIRKAVRDLPKFIRTKLKERVQRKVAQIFLDRLKRNLFSQNLNLQPLTDAYLAFKQREGLDQRILLATQTAIEGLHIFRSGDMTVAGAEPNQRSADGKIDLAELWAVLEMGSPSKNIPARPSFELTRMELEKELKRIAIKEIQLAADGFYAEFR